MGTFKKFLAGVIVVLSIIWCAQDIATAATAISYGQTVTGSITAAGQKNEYTFTAAGGDMLMVRGAKTSGTINLYADIYNPSGALIKTSAATNFDFSLAAAGVHKIVVRDYAATATGAYELTIQCANRPANAGTLTFNQPGTGTLASRTKLNAFKLALAANDTVMVRSVKTATTSGTFDSYVDLYNVTGAKIAYGGSITKKVPANGNYSVFFYDSSYDGTGTYSFYTQRLNNPVGATAIAFGQTVSGVVNPAVSMATYKFSANANDIINVGLKDINTTSGSYMTNMDLYNQTGASIGSVSAGKLTKKLASAGQYYLMAYDYWMDGTGKFECSLQRINNPVNPVVLAFGASSTGAITNVTEIDPYIITAAANDTIIVRAGTNGIYSGTFFSPNMELFDPAGNSLVSTAGNILTKANATGNYTLLVTEQGRDATGVYAVSAQRLNNPVGAKTVNFGQTIADDITPVSDVSVLSVAAAANDTIAVYTAKVSMGSDKFSLGMEVYAPNGTLLQSTITGTQLYQKINTTGTYRIIISDANRDATGTYEATIERTNNPGVFKAVSFNQTVEDALLSLSDINVYRVNITAPTPLTFCSAIRSSTFGSFDSLNVELFAPNGTRMQYGMGGFQYTAATPGAWHIFVYERSQDGTGTYRFTVRNANVTCSSLDLVDPQVNMTAPRAGEIVENNRVYPIKWTSSDNKGVTAQEIRLSLDSGATFPTVIAGNITPSPFAQMYNWTIPGNLSSAQARIKISAWDAQGNQGASITNGDFIIANTTMPAGAQNATYTYDKENRLTKSAAGNLTANYTYDALGNRLNLN